MNSARLPAKQFFDVTHYNNRIWKECPESNLYRTGKTPVYSEQQQCAGTVPRVKMPLHDIEGTKLAKQPAAGDTCCQQPVPYACGAIPRSFISIRIHANGVLRNIPLLCRIPAEYVTNRLLVFFRPEIVVAAFAALTQIADARSERIQSVSSIARQRRYGIVISCAGFGYGRVGCPDIRQ